MRSAVSNQRSTGTTGQALLRLVWLGLLTLVLSSCGGGGTLLPQQGSQTPSDSTALGEAVDFSQLRSIAPLPEPTPGSSSQLPALDALAQPLRALSAVGYGYQSLSPDSAVATALTTANPGGSLTFTPGPSTAAYAIYGLSGFDGDNYPVSAKLGFTGASGEFYVAFPDYNKGRWQLEGPFTGSTEVAITLRDQPEGLQNFVSSSNNSYFALLFPAGGASAELSSVEFGVNGGSMGPQPPTLIGTDTGDLGVVLRWFPSADRNAADFSGYIVERAPQFAGDYVALTTAPSPWHDYYDNTAVAGQSYRYRLFAVDTSGQRSAPTGALINVSVGAQLNPVPRVRLSAKGPFQAPANLLYDMSDSYDPEGEALFGHALGGMFSGDVLGTGEIGNLVLGVGTHFIACEVSAGTRMGSSYVIETAYPQWESSSNVIVPSDPATTFFPRVLLASFFRLPGDALPWATGFDYAGNCIAFVRTNGGQLEHHRASLTNLPVSISRVVVANGAAWIAVTDANGIVSLLRFDGTTTSTSLINSSSDYPSTVALCASAEPGGLRTFEIFSSDGVNYGLRSTNLAGDETIIIATGASTTGNSPLVALPSSVAGSFDIFFTSSAGATGCFRWDSLTNTFVPSLLNGMMASRITAAINPVTGHPACAYHIGGTWFYRSYDGAVWSAEAMASAVASEQSGELLFSNGLACLLTAEATGQLVLRERSAGGVWSDRNRPVMAPDAGVNCALTPGDLPGELLALDSIQGAAGRETLALSLLPADSATELYRMSGINLTGIDFDATGGADGLHLAGRPSLLVASQHYTSPDALTWTPTPLPGNLSSLRLGTNAPGDVYLGAIDGGSGDGELFWWDAAGTAWVDEAAGVTISENESLVLEASPASTTVRLVGFDTVGGNLNEYRGDHTGGYATNSFAVADTFWLGSSMAGNYFGLAGGMDPRDGILQSYEGGLLLPICDPLAEGSLALMSQPLIGHRSQAAGGYLHRSNNAFLVVEEKLSFVSSYGSVLNPLRSEIGQSGLRTTVDLDYNSGSIADFLTRENRRTVTMATTRSANAFCLIANIDNSANRFEWTGEFGWEALPLPPIDNMMYPKLVAGVDGRLHIVYYDYLTDEVLIRSTVGP